jgi:O-antigen ligase
MTGFLRGYEDWTLRLLVVLTCVFIGAGGLGAATSVGLMGLLLLPMTFLPALRASRAVTQALVCFAVAVAWIGLSLIWSPYDRPDQLIKLAILTPLYTLAVFSFVRLDDDRAQTLLAWLSVSVGLLAVYFLIEAVSGARLSVEFKLAFEPLQDRDMVLILANRLLARGLTAFILVGGPVALALWIYGSRLARSIAVGIFLSGLAGAFAFQVEANAMALLAGVLAGAIAWRFPRTALQLGFWIAAAMIIAAPLVMGAMLSLIPDSLIDSLPLSWAQRIEIWRFAMDQIAAAPIAGHGLDASRVINEVTMIRGFEMELLPLHAHNAGLSIWLETGAIGAILIGGTLIAIGQSLSQRLIDPLQSASIAYACTAFFVTVSVGSGIWQEWLHASLAFALAATALIRKPSA